MSQQVPKKSDIINFILVIICFSVWIFPHSLMAQTLGDRRSAPFSSGNSKTGVRSFGTEIISGGTQGDISMPAYPMGSGGDNIFYYNVHILGEVARPGTYKSIPSDRITDVLKYAGGANPNGSQRFIQLRREGKTKILDIFSYMYLGNLEHNPYIVENDVIFVPVKKGEFRIEGPVNRPNHYELTQAINMKAAVKMAGEFAIGVDKQQAIKVIRFDQTGKKNLLEVPIDEEPMQRFAVQKGDVIIIPHLLLRKKKFDYSLSRIPGDNIFYPTMNDKVYVIGAVAQSGPIEFQPSFDYKQYVGLAGPTNLASINRVKVIRADGKKFAARHVKEINPGDTIIVPSRQATFTNALTIFNTITTTFLTTVTIREVLKDF